MNVVRFSHLSVQEYLETRGEIWEVGVIDAQLLVCESCLWILQSSLELPLYEYAANRWLRHCRLYQDLVLSVINRNGTKYEMSIPLLNSFLGSFGQASPDYVRWVDWIRAQENTPLMWAASTCPAFSAALAGLGELVSW